MNYEEEVKQNKKSTPTSTPTPTLTCLVETELPELCQYIIYKKLHKMHMKNLCREIEHNVVWVRLRSGNNYRYQFLTSTQQNYPVWNE